MADRMLWGARPTLPLAVSEVIIDTAMETARRSDMLAMSVVVLDAGGHMIAFKREDGSGLMRAQIAFGKAWGALGMGASSRHLRDRLTSRPTFVSALTDVSGGRFVPVPGGVLIIDDEHYTIGSVGVSGDTSEKDEYCAIRGIHGASLKSVPDAPDPNWQASKL